MLRIKLSAGRQFSASKSASSPSAKTLSAIKMKKLIRNILPYLITSLVVIGIWKLSTSTENYAWNPKGKEPLMLDIALTSIFFYKTIFWLITTNLVVFGLLKLKQKKLITSGISILLALIFFFTVRPLINKKCAFHYYSVFHNQSVAEGYIVEPIEEAGYEIGPLLIQKISDKEMKYRRYAILGLQKINYQPATSLMVKILFDTSELGIFRADAYEALRTFDNRESNNHIAKFKSQANDSVDFKVIELGEYFYSNREE